jgi:hypothetical protein
MARRRVWVLACPPIGVSVSHPYARSAEERRGPGPSGITRPGGTGQTRARARRAARTHLSSNTQARVVEHAALARVVLSRDVDARLLVQPPRRQLCAAAPRLLLLDWAASPVGRAFVCHMDLYGMVRIPWRYKDGV